MAEWEVNTWVSRKREKSAVGISRAASGHRVVEADGGVMNTQCNAGNFKAN